MAQIGRPHAAIPYTDRGDGTALVEDPPGSGLYSQSPDPDDED